MVLTVVVTEQYVLIDYEVITFDEILMEQIKFITFNNGTYNIACGEWYVPKEYLGGWLQLLDGGND